MSAKGHVICQIACAKDQCCSMLHAPSTQNMSINVKVKKNGAKATGVKKSQQYYCTDCSNNYGHM